MSQTRPKLRNIRVVQGWEVFYFWLLTLVAFALLGWAGFRWNLVAEWDRQLFATSLASFALLFALGIQLARWFFLLLMIRPIFMEPEDGLRVAMVTSFVPGLESLEMLQKTLEAMMRVRYPHKTWVLDEGDSPEVKELCRRLGVNHYSRKTKPEYLRDDGPFKVKTKYGNYNAWLDDIGYERYEMIACFDPDHIPYEDFLDRTLGYMNDPAIGYVQATQVYYNQAASFIARGAAEETYAYPTIQMACYAAGYPVVTGCHQLHRAKALEEVGGFAQHDADDLLITLHYRAAGWHGVYVPEVLAKGLTPVDWPGYMLQQLRWARSVLDVKFRVFPRVAGRLPWSTRTMTLLHGFYYLQEVVLALAGYLLLSWLVITGECPSFLWSELLVWLLPFSVGYLLLDFWRQRYFLLPNREWGTHWRAVLLRIVKWPYLALGAWQAVRGTEKAYSVTPKARTGTSPHMLWPHLAIALLLVLLGIYRYLFTSEALAGGTVFWLGTAWSMEMAIGLSEFIHKFPEPYDGALWKDERRDRGRYAS